MSLLINVSPQIESQIISLAKSEGIEPSELIEKLVNEYRPSGKSTEVDELGGKTLGELYCHLFGTVSFEPNDVSERAEEYLASTGFGETLNRRDISA